LNQFASFLARVQSDLEEQDSPWCLIGGLAVGVRTEPRFTRDLDFAVVCPNDVDSETFIFRLVGKGYGVVAVLEQNATGRLATVRMTLPETDEPVVADFLFASSGAEAEIVTASELVEIVPGLRLPVACIGDLVAMKVLARDDRLRPQDRLDLNALLARAREQDLNRARFTLRRIESLGANRGRPLLEELDQVIVEFSPRS
jgi:hypothetical protein